METPEMIYEDQNRERTTFNFSLATLERWNIILTTCIEASIVGNGQLWYHSLLALYRELAPFMVENKKGYKYLPKVDRSREDINEFLKKDHNELSTETISPELYQEFQKFEIKLRKIIHEIGAYMSESRGGASLYGE